MFKDFCCLSGFSDRFGDILNETKANHAVLQTQSEVDGVKTEFS